MAAWLRSILKRRRLTRIWVAAVDSETRAAERRNRAKWNVRRSCAGGAVARGARATDGSGPQRSATARSSTEVRFDSGFGAFSR